MFRKFSLLLVAVLFFLSLSTSLVIAKDYTIPSADFVVQINPDGSANVTETRTYSFDGNFTWADEWIYPKGSTISNITLQGGQLTQDITSGKVYLKWYYQASSEIKTFTLRYKIDHAVINHQDISEFYWQLIGGEWTKGTGKVNAKVLLPYPVTDNQIYAFGH